jgi:hypothetical protein
VCCAGEDYALLLDMQNMNLNNNNNSQAQHAGTHVQVEEEPPASLELAVLQLQGANSSSYQRQQLFAPGTHQQVQLQQQQLANSITADEPCQSTIPGDISWKQLLQAEAPVLQQQQQQQGLDQELSIHIGAAGQQRRSYSICSSGSSSSSSEAGNNGSLEQLEVAMKQALSPSSGAASFLPAHGSLHSQVRWC